MNLDLMRPDQLPVVNKAADRLVYYETLDKAHTKNEHDDFLYLCVPAEVEAL